MDARTGNGELDGARLWAGGIAAALVAALVAIVGILAARGLVGVSVLSPESHGAWGGANTVTYAFSAAGVALAATALMHVLVLTTPRPRLFFGWIVALVTAISIVVPLSLPVALSNTVATAIINLVIGLSIIVTLTNVARAALTRDQDMDREDPTRQYYSR